MVVVVGAAAAAMLYVVQCTMLYVVVVVVVVVGGYGGQNAGDTVFAGSGFLAASPSLTCSRLANNHANISTSFHPYRR